MCRRIGGRGPGFGRGHFLPQCVRPRLAFIKPNRIQAPANQSIFRQEPMKGSALHYAAHTPMTRANPPTLANSTMAVEKPTGITHSIGRGPIFTSPRETRPARKEWIRPSVTYSPPPARRSCGSRDSKGLKSPHLYPWPALAADSGTPVLALPRR